ncbi:MAG: sigma-70 family RNA polymerase sigma factor [Polyangiaceae bacterium]
MLAKTPFTATPLGPTALGSVRTLIVRLAHQLARQAGVPQAADDLAQIGFEQAWRLTPHYDSTRGAFSTFIYPRVRGAMLDALAWEYRRPPHVDCALLEVTPLDAPSPEEQLAAARDYARLSERVRSWLDKLAPLDRMLVEACVMDDFTVAEASEVLEVGYEWARWRLKRALETLGARRTLSNRIGGEGER